MGEIDLDALAPWLGRTETKEDVLTHGLIDKFRATLGPHLWDGSGDVPLGIHWCISLDTVPATALSEDGHAATQAALNASTLSHAKRRTSSRGNALAATSNCWKACLSRALASAACTR